MKIFHSINDFKSDKKSIVTIGTFDGVHIGHKKIIELLNESKNDDCENLILTFFPHPRMVLQSGEEIKLLNTIEEKSMLLDQQGVQNLVIHPFDKEFSNLTAEEFVSSILVEKFNIKKIIIGHDHRFGKNRSADFNDLKIFGEKYNFEVEQIPSQTINDISISSTKIRNALNEGLITKANKYLGYDYFISGKVVQGKQLGRTIGFPTANLEIDQPYKLVPKNGVYMIYAFLNNKKVFGMMNIGNRPTVDGTDRTIEAHFIDFNENLYDQKITISIVEKIRDEIKFESLEKLKSQIKSDKDNTIKFFEK